MSNALQNMKYCVFIEKLSFIYLLHHIAIAKIGYLVKDQFYKYKTWFYDLFEDR